MQKDVFSLRAWQILRQWKGETKGRNPLIHALSIQAYFRSSSQCIVVVQRALDLKNRVSHELGIVHAGVNAWQTSDYSQNMQLIVLLGGEEVGFQRHRTIEKAWNLPAIG